MNVNRMRKYVAKQFLAEVFPGSDELDFVVDPDTDGNYEEVIRNRVEHFKKQINNKYGRDVPLLIKSYFSPDTYKIYVKVRISNVA